MSHKRQSAHLHKQDEWKQLYESGLSFTQIAKKEGIHYSTVKNVIKDVITIRPKQQFAHLVNEWVSLYEEGLSITDIGEKYHADPNTVSKYLKEAGIELRRKSGKTSTFEKYIPQWIIDYNNGKSLKEIADEYGTFPQTVHKHIKDKTDMREYIETSIQYPINKQDFFENINSHEKAYWLGIWFGTGFISKTVTGFECTLSLGAKDVNTLIRFKEAIGYEKPLFEFKSENSHAFRLRIFNKNFYDQLVRLGLCENKEENLRFPKLLKQEFYNSFLLGYYEGKGAAYISKYKVQGKEYKMISFRLFGNLAMLNTLHKVVLDETGIDLAYILMKGEKRGRKDLHYITSNNKSKIKKIAEWIYRDSSTFSPDRDIRIMIENFQQQRNK